MSNDDFNKDDIDKLIDETMNDPNIPDSDPDMEITFEDPGKKYLPEPESEPKRKKSKKKSDPSAEEEDKRPRITISKYSSGPTGILYESIFVGGQQWFVYTDDKGMLKLVENIQEDDRILIPPSRSECFTKPYIFADAEELNKFWSEVKNLTVDDLFFWSRKIWLEYLSHKSHIINFFTAASILTYFQDKFYTTFYPFIIGDTNSGKGTVIEIAELIVYRPYRASSVSEASIYRTLSSIEEGQAIMLLDEVNRMSEQMIEIHKGGYKSGSFVIRVDEVGSVRRVTKFLTFGQRWYVAEKSLDGEGAKGLNERCFYVHAIKGKPKKALWKVLSHDKAKKFRKRLTEFEFFRKRMLLYKLLHFNDSFPDVKINHNFREEELVGPMLGLFYHSQYKQDVVDALDKCLEERNKVKQESKEALLHGIVMKLQSDELVSENPDRKVSIDSFNQKNPKSFAASLDRIDDLFLVESESEWKYHHDNEASKTTMISKRFGEISAKDRTKILKDKFGGISTRLFAKGERFRVWIFPKEILNSLTDAYEDYKNLEILGIEDDEIEDYSIS